MVRVKTSSGILRPRERFPLRNLLGGKILPRAVPDMSATRHSTSLILRSPIHSSNFACDMINQWLCREHSLAGLWLTAQTGLATPVGHDEIDRRAVLLSGDCAAFPRSIRAPGR